MVSMTIRNVPDETRDRLATRAARAGQSLQEYMRAVLVGMADRPTNDELLDRVRARVAAGGSSVTSDDIVQALREDRESH